MNDFQVFLKYLKNVEHLIKMLTLEVIASKDGHSIVVIFVIIFFTDGCSFEFVLFVVVFVSKNSCHCSFIVSR